MRCLHLKSSLRLLPRSSPTLALFLSGNVFARAPMILPGMPSGRPCALARTSARTRKHCNFLLSPWCNRESDNARLFAPRSPASILLQLRFSFCLLNTVLPLPIERPPAFARIIPPVFDCQLPSRSPSPRLITLTAPWLASPAPRSSLFAEVISPTYFNISTGEIALILEFSVLFPSAAWPVAFRRHRHPRQPARTPSLELTAT
jgi:hypothetical protein